MASPRQARAGRRHVGLEQHHDRERIEATGGEAGEVGRHDELVVLAQAGGHDDLPRAAPGVEQGPAEGVGCLPGRREHGDLRRRHHGGEAGGERAAVGRHHEGVVPTDAGSGEGEGH